MAAIAQFSTHSSRCTKQIRRHVALVRSLSTTSKGGPKTNLPTNDTIKALSNRDKQFFAQVKDLRSTIDHDPPVLIKGFQPTGFSKNGVYMGSTFLQYPPQSLPQICCSALLDPKTYCKKSASAQTTISGSDAARRLIRGKRNLMDTLRTDVHGHQKDVKKMYILQDHGVPVQLLQHHLDVAHSWLLRSSSNYQDDDDGSYELSVENLFGTKHFDRMLVRTNDGASRISLWPKEWDNDMGLYLTVMNRLAGIMSNILHRDAEQQGLPRLTQWNVVCQRDLALPPQLLLPDTTCIHPVIEFVPSMGKVSIRLQGNVGVDDKTPVSMIYEGIFDTKEELRGGNFLW